MSLNFMVKNEWTLFVVLFIGALANFIPVWLGYTLADPVTGEYPSFLYELENFYYRESVVASLASSVPLILEQLLDWISLLVILNPERKAWGQASYIPFKEIILLIVIPDLLFLFWIIPYHQFDYMAAIIGARDTLYIYSFLSYIVHLRNPIWTWASSIYICFAFMFSNLLATCQSQLSNSSQSFMKFTSIVLPFCVALGILNILVNSIRWIHYVLTCEKGDKTEELKKLLISVSCMFYFIFVSGDWLIFFVPNVSLGWTNVGAYYLTLYTYLMALCTLCLTIISSRLLRIEATEAKVIALM